MPHDAGTTRWHAAIPVLAALAAGVRPGPDAAVDFATLGVPLALPFAAAALTERTRIAIAVTVAGWAAAFAASYWLVDRPAIDAFRPLLEPRAFGGIVPETALRALRFGAALSAVTVGLLFSARMTRPVPAALGFAATLAGMHYIHPLGPGALGVAGTLALGAMAAALWLPGARARIAAHLARIGDSMHARTRSGMTALVGAAVMSVAIGCMGFGRREAEALTDPREYESRFLRGLVDGAPLVAEWQRRGADPLALDLLAKQVAAADYYAAKNEGAASGKQVLAASLAALTFEGDAEAHLDRVRWRCRALAKIDAYSAPQRRPRWSPLPPDILPQGKPPRAETLDAALQFLREERTLLQGPEVGWRYLNAYPHLARMVILPRDLGQLGDPDGFRLETEEFGWWWLEIDVATIRLAAECHRRDNGTYPQTLEALVPDYLDWVPKVPMNGQPYRFGVDASGLFFVQGPGRL